MRRTITTRWFANPNWGNNNVLHNLWSSHKYLIYCESENSHAPQLCWLLNLDWLLYFEHVVRSLFQHMFVLVYVLTCHLHIGLQIGVVLDLCTSTLWGYMFYIYRCAEPVGGIVLYNVSELHLHPWNLNVSGPCSLWRVPEEKSKWCFSFERLFKLVAQKNSAMHRTLTLAQGSLWLTCGVHGSRG
jgi:hypothetical protein